MRRAPNESLCVQVAMLWEESVLELRALPSGGSLWIGDGTRSNCPCDIVVPRDVLGFEILQLIAGGRDCYVAIPPAARATLTRSGQPSSSIGEASDAPSRVLLRAGDRLELRLGKLVFAVEAFEDDQALRASLRSGRAWMHSLYVAGAAALHLAVLGMAALSAPPSAGWERQTVTQDQLLIMQTYLNASAERDRQACDEPDQTELREDCREGGTGTRAQGDEGSKGDPPSGRLGGSHSIYHGPSGADPHVARAAALRDAASFGMIGLLNAGAGGNRNAPDGSMGSATGQGFGSGRGALGGRGEGIGLGSIGTIGHGAGTGNGRGLGGAASPRPRPEARLEVPIDPNGRFATTYRPGRGHLAAFESAVARGVLPVATRELVSDIGAAYAPDLAPPKDRALAYQAALERRELPPGGGATHLRLALRSSDRAGAERPHLSVHLVLDVSGSMSGESLERAKEAAHHLATEVDKRLDPAATAVEIRVRLKEGVELLRVYGSRRLGEDESARVRTAEIAADAHAARREGIARDRQDDRQGGMRFFIPAFARGDSYALLLKVSAPPGAGARDAALVELRYKDRVTARNVYEEIPLRFAYANDEALSALTTDPSVQRSVQGFLAGETLMGAAAEIEAGDRQAASSLLAERERILRQAASTLGEPAFLADAARFARLRTHVEGPAGEGQTKALAMLLETAAHSHLR